MTTATLRQCRNTVGEEVVAAIQRNGGLVIEDFIDSSTVAGIVSDLEPDLAQQQFGDRTKRLSSLFARTRHSGTIVTQPLYLGAARALLQQPKKVWLGQELHRDDSVHLRPHPGPESRLQIMVAITEFAAENGGARVIPGSHRWDSGRPPRAHMVQSAPRPMESRGTNVWNVKRGHGKY